MCLSHFVIPNLMLFHVHPRIIFFFNGRLLRNFGTFCELHPFPGKKRHTTKTTQTGSMHVIATYHLCNCCMVNVGQYTIVSWILLLMEEILHHLGCMKPYKQWDIYHINWCRILSINSMGESQKMVISRNAEAERVAFGGVTWWMGRKSTPVDLVTSLLWSLIASL